MKFILAQMVPEQSPYGTKLIPEVICGNHLEYVPGTRFDYGFLSRSLEQGYQVIILPQKEELPQEEERSE